MLEQDILSYLSMFVEPAYAGASLSTVHPVDLVLDALSDPENAKRSVRKLHTFLEETMKVHGKKFECASPPVTHSSTTVCVCVCFLWCDFLFVIL